ncbi:MAG TPA: hypothetical protein VHO71_02675 [Caproiciproducens sp.]|nr:hypothetical protein [Caproiciproducens sp.]
MEDLMIRIPIFGITIPLYLIHFLLILSQNVTGVKYMPAPMTGNRCRRLSGGLSEDID